jgi:hypothetical protein
MECSILSYHYILGRMQGLSNTPTDEAEAPIPTETVSMSNEPHFTVLLRRKAAKRTLPWDEAAGELLVSQVEDNLAKKKPRLEEPLPTTTDEAVRNIASPDISVDLPPPVVDNDDVYANADPVTDTQPKTVATRATGRWTTDEDAELTRAVTKTSKKKHGKEYTTDWVAISALVPGRTRGQCLSRWQDVLDPTIALTAGPEGN